MAIVSNGIARKGVAFFEDAISMTGYGRFQLFVLLAAGGSLMCVIVETMEMMYIIPAAQCDLNLGLTEKGILSSVNYLGVFTTSHLWGFIADTKGRRKVILISLLMSFLFSLLSSISPNAWIFILMRYLNGIFIAGSSAVTYAYAGEFHNNHYRPKVVSWMATFVAFATIFLPSVAWILLPATWSLYIPFLNFSYRPWRLLITIYSLPCLIFGFLVYLLPESPKYLLSKGDRTQSLEILKNIYTINSGKDKDNYEVTELAWEELDVIEKTEKKSNLLNRIWQQTVPLFRKPYLVKTVMVCFIQFAIFFYTCGITMWYPEILNSMSSYMEKFPEEKVSLCSSVIYDKNQTSNSGNVAFCSDHVDTKVFWVTIMIGVLYALCYIIIGSFINFVGKKRMLITTIAISTFFGLLSQNIQGYALIQVSLGMYIMGGCAIAVTTALTVDIFPTQVRGMALSLSLMFGRVGAVSTSNITGLLIYRLCDYIFYIFGANNLVLVIVVLLLPSAPLGT